MRARDVVLAIAMLAGALAVVSTVSDVLQSRATRPRDVAYKPPSPSMESPALPDTWHPLKLVGR